MPVDDGRLRIAFVAPHLFEGGGNRRVLELANRLVKMGDEVTFLLPSDERLACRWMPCAARVARIDDHLDDLFDVVIANEETQWHHLDRFSSARRTCFFLLHDGTTYDKPGSWEALRAHVDLKLANSSWTAERAEAATGVRPEVLPGGVNPEHFRPVAVPKRYDVLAVGDPRPWKGHDTIVEACRLAGLELASFFDRGLPQHALAAEYSAARVFAVGSVTEGFGQPGIEALACGTPLVTTDNGGCRDYAVHEETALLVPARDPEAMAVALRRLHDDTELAERLVGNGLELVATRFDWDIAAKALHERLTQLVAEPSEKAALHPRQIPRPEHPRLSLVVLQWNQVHHTQRCVQSLRTHTTSPYELILVDNGSEPAAAAYARQAGDVAVLHEENRGFSGGMNAGLAEARGDIVVFVNNDTVFPPDWDTRLLETFADHPRAGIVAPVVTEAGNEVTVRDRPGTERFLIPPFDAPPSAVVWAMHTDLVRRLGGWSEDYEIAAAEDIDLCFTTWVNGLDVVVDERVLIDHVGKGSAVQLGDWTRQWAANRGVFLAKWTAPDLRVPNAGVVDDELFERNLQTARSVTTWMARYHAVGGRPVGRVVKRAMRLGRSFVVRVMRGAKRYRNHPVARRLRATVERSPAARRFIQRWR